MTDTLDNFIFPVLDKFNAQVIALSAQVWFHLKGLTLCLARIILWANKTGAASERKINGTIWTFCTFVGSVLWLVLFCKTQIKNQWNCYTAQKMKFSITDLVIFTKEIRNGKLCFLCSAANGCFLQNMERNCSKLSVQTVPLNNLSESVVQKWSMRKIVLEHFANYRGKHLWQESLF